MFSISATIKLENLALNFWKNKVIILVIIGNHSDITVVVEQQ